MERIANLIPEPLIVSEYQSCDKRQLAEKDADEFNLKVGNLNEKDGIDCPICKNKGWIAITKKVYEDCDVLTMFTARCECMKLRKAKEQVERSNLGDLLKFRVKDFNAVDEWQKDLKQLIVDYIMDKNGHWLALLGSSGAGKTHLCSAVANSFLKNGIEVRYTVWTTMTKELKKDVFSQEGTKEMLNDLINVPVLYIDDLFKGIVSEQDVSLMFDLLNHRYNAERITIISSERTVEELARIDVAITGRIKERCGKYLCQIVGIDKNYRFKP